jgi:hypothetical protein
MLHRPLTLAVAFLGAWYLAYRYADRQREAARARAQPRHLQTWEGEGGGVPVGGSRTAAQVEAEGLGLAGTQGPGTARVQS